LGGKEGNGRVNVLNPVDLRPREIGLFLDVDGTLLDLASSPDSVEVPAGLRDTLAAAAGCLDGALALVSGRPIEDLDRLFAPLRLRASGIHGAQIRDAAGGLSRWLTQARLPDGAWPGLLRLLEAFPGTLAENKGIGFAVHYRNSPAAEEELLVALRHFIEPFVELDLELIAGHRVFEIRLPGFDKGRAIESFMARQPFAGRIPVFVADDRMDRAGFDAALALGGLAFSVGAAQPGLSGWFAKPAAVRAWLGQLAR
jgi:trehalose 6-phosphate phosphatase